MILASNEKPRLSIDLHEEEEDVMVIEMSLLMNMV